MRLTNDFTMKKSTAKTERLSKSFYSVKANLVSIFPRNSITLFRRRRANTTTNYLLPTGKSTTLKNFQLNYTPHAFQAERESWRSVIVLNLLKSIHTILGVLSSISNNSGPNAPSPTISSSSFTLLQMRLSPLRHAEDLLRRNLATLPLDDPTDSDIDSIFEYDTSSYEWQNTNNRRSQEFTIRNRGGAGWQTTLARLRPGSSNGNGNGHDSSTATTREMMRNGSSAPGLLGKEDEYINIVANCREDMIALWNDKAVRKIVAEKRLRIEESSGL